MKMPINCPFCGDVLNTEYPTSEVPEIEFKTCARRTTHYVRFIFIHNIMGEDEVYEIILRISDSPLTYVKWIFMVERVRVVADGVKNDIYLPWWEPDLSDYYKLMKKVKTYMLFS